MPVLQLHDDLCFALLQVAEPRKEPLSSVTMPTYACQRPTPLTHHNSILSVSCICEGIPALENGDMGVAGV